MAALYRMYMTVGLKAHTRPLVSASSACDNGGRGSGRMGEAGEGGTEGPGGHRSSSNVHQPGIPCAQGALARPRRRTLRNNASNSSAQARAPELGRDSAAAAVRM